MGNLSCFNGLQNLVIILVLTVATTIAQDFYSGTDVVELTPSNFRAKVLEDDHIWMIEFYAPWCGHCQRLKPDYIKAATASKGIVRFGAINCDVHKSLASDYGIRGFPTLKLFGSNKKRPEDYNGARSPKAMADAAIALLPNLVTVVTPRNRAEFLAGGGGALPKALLFTAKGSTTALYKALALDLKGRMQLGEVRAKKDPSLLAEYGVSESDLPVLLVVSREGSPGDGGPASEEGAEGGDSSKHPRYEGELKHKPLLKFLAKYAKPKSTKATKEPAEGGKGKQSSGSSSGSSSSNDKSSAGAGEATKPSPSAARPGSGPAVPRLASPKDAESHCLKGKGLCIIALLPGDAGEPTVKQHLDALVALEAKYHKDPLRFSWVDVAAKPGVKSLFVESSGGIAGVEPEALIVVLSPKRGRFALQHGFEGLEGVLDRAIGGDLTLQLSVEEYWHDKLAST